MKTIAIIGRPNVGKSTLFNRILGKKKAIVDDTPGVTRDWRDEVTTIFDVPFRIIDTAGLEKAESNSLGASMLKSTEAAVAQADLLLLVVDAFSGVVPLDQQFVRWVRKQSKPLILVANKCEKKAAEIATLYRLGLGEPVPVSAEHGLGMADLFHRIVEETGVDIYESDRLKAEAEEAAWQAGPKEVIEEIADGVDISDDDKIEEAPKPSQLQIAIIGRPNAGKSTIINKILGQERVITNEMAGTTRDAIAIDWEYKEQKIRLIDTAGMRRKSHIDNRLETFSVKDSLYAIRYAQVVFLVMDAAEALEKQDLRLANHVVEEGRAIIIVVNKWDLVKDKKAFSEELDYLVNKQLGDIHGVKIVKVSALNDKSLAVLLDAALEAYQIWNTRVSTGKLNNWIEYVLSHHPPPISKGRRIKIRYITQTKTRPPTFMLSCSQPDNMPDSYLKYFINDLREKFNMPGVPIRIIMPKKTNPYEYKKNDTSK